MFIKLPEGIMDLGITKKEYLEVYCILLDKSMYGNFDSVLLWLRPLHKYLVNECYLKRSK